MNTMRSLTGTMLKNKKCWKQSLWRCIFQRRPALDQKSSARAAAHWKGPENRRAPPPSQELFIEDIVESYLKHHLLDDAGTVHVRMKRLEVEAAKPWLIRSEPLAIQGCNLRFDNGRSLLRPKLRRLITSCSAFFLLNFMSADPRMPESVK